MSGEVVNTLMPQTFAMGFVDCMAIKLKKMSKKLGEED